MGMTNAEENARDRFEDLASRHMLDGVERAEAERMAHRQLHVEAVQRIACPLDADELRQLRRRDRNRKRGKDGMILTERTPPEFRDELIAMARGET
jgi:hypothetical protein